MDGERQAPIDSPWNRWLVGQAVSLTRAVLRDDLFQLFGADAYLALRSRGEARPDWFRKGLAQELKTASCWPSRATTKGKIEYRSAKEIVSAEIPALDGFLSDKRYLHPRLAGVSEIREMAQQFETQPFRRPPSGSCARGTGDSLRGSWGTSATNRRPLAAFFLNVFRTTRRTDASPNQRGMACSGSRLSVSRNERSSRGNPDQRAVPAQPSRHSPHADRSSRGKISGG